MAQMEPMVKQAAEWGGVDHHEFKRGGVETLRSDAADGVAVTFFLCSLV